MITKDEEVVNISMDELNELVTRCHPYIQEVVRIYGEQGCIFDICSACGMIRSIKYPKGKTYAGPSLSSLMYCQHRNQVNMEETI